MNASTQVATDKVVARIGALLQPVEAICRGHKPDSYPYELMNIMVRMWEEGFLSEAPASYVFLPNEAPSDENLLRLKGQTWVHPISQELTVRKQNIDYAAATEKIFNYKILGLDPYYRRLSRSGGVFDACDPLEMAEDAKALILTRSDMHGLRQALHILQAKLLDDARVRDTALIIQNTHNGFWDPLFSYLGINPCDPAELRARNIFVTNYPGGGDTTDENRTSTLHVLRDLGPQMALAPKPDRMDAVIQPGDRVYVASGSAHKPIEVADAFAAMLARVLVQPLNSSLNIKPQEAEETSCSLEGNNIEKMLSAAQRILGDIGFDEACRELCPGGRPENTWIVFDDRGLEFRDHRIIQTRAFDPIRDLLNPYKYKPGPGAELAWILKTISRTRLFEEMLAGAVAEIRAKTGEDPDTTVVDTACHVTVRLDWLREQEPKFIATFAKVRSRALTAPQPTLDAQGRPIRAFQTDHYLVPLAFNRDASAPEQRTKAEIDRYVATNSEVAGSLRALGSLTGIEQHSENLARFNLIFRTAARGEKLALATLHSLFPDIYGHGTAHLHRAVNGALNGSFRLLSGSNGRYSMSRFWLSRPMTESVRTGPAHREAVSGTLGRLRELYQDADGFILTEDNPRLAELPGLKWLKTLVYYSLVVGKQVDDRAIKSKFFGILNAGDNAWAQQEQIFDHLAQTPLLMNKYTDLVQTHSTKSNLKDALKTFRTGYIRPAILEKDTVAKTDGRAMPDDLYRVTIYCSASLGHHTEACKEARGFAFGLARDGFGVINGGGKEGLMVATSEGVHDFRRWQRHHAKGQPYVRNHVTSYQCHDTFEREGGWHKDNDDARIFETIEERMANLMNTDAEVLMAGGAGSIQEIAASLLMRQWGLVPVKNRPLVIVNQDLDGVRAFDPLIGMLSREERQRLNVHVVRTGDEALRILQESRHAMRHALGAGAIYIPAAAPGPGMRAQRGGRPEIHVA